jgi:hypothetical protein
MVLHASVQLCRYCKPASVARAVAAASSSIGARGQVTSCRAERIIELGVQSLSVVTDRKIDVTRYSNQNW